MNSTTENYKEGYTGKLKKQQLIIVAETIQ
jgi:hypothetical protein